MPRRRRRRPPLRWPRHPRPHRPPPRQRPRSWCRRPRRPSRAWRTQPSIFPMPARRCESSRASAASICVRSRAAGRVDASCPRTWKPSPKLLRRPLQRKRLPPPRRASTCCRGPKVDFAKFGPIESKPLSRIKKISGANLHRNWVMIPHVTNHDEADITELEAFRVQLNKEIEKSGVRVSMLAFMIKAAVAALKKFPEFNSSLDGDNLILKKY